MNDTNKEAPPDSNLPSLEELNRWIPDYQFLAFVDHGGMGAVYQAFQKRLGRIVAVKILRPPSGADTDEMTARFKQEAHVLACLGHKNIVTVFDFGESPSGHLYYSMEFVHGNDLRHFMLNGRMDSKKALNIINQVCEALQAAHDANIIHRDIKPGNILIDQHGVVKVADFGLAKFLSPDASNGGMTAPDVTFGTRDYIAPEALHSNTAVDHRGDIFSLGVMFYEMLTGEIPKGVWEAPSKTFGTDSNLDHVMMQALQSDPSRRFQNAREMTLQIQKAMQGTVTAPLQQDATSFRKWFGWTMGILSLVALVYGAIWLLTPKPKTEGQAPPSPPPPLIEEPVYDKAHRELTNWVLLRKGFVSYQNPGDPEPVLDDPNKEIRRPVDVPSKLFNVWRVSLQGSPVESEEEFKTLIDLCAKAGTVMNLNICESTIGSKSLSELPRLKDTLKFLNIQNVPIFDEYGLAQIAKCTNLRVLFLTKYSLNAGSESAKMEDDLLMKLQASLPKCHIIVNP